MGPRKTAPGNKLIEVEDTTDLTEGEIVAVKLEDWEEKPVLGKVVSLLPDNMFKIWYMEPKDGNFLSPLSTMSVSNKRGKFVPYTDVLTRRCIKLFKLSLRKDKKLSNASVKALSDEYKDLGLIAKDKRSKCKVWTLTKILFLSLWYCS